MDPIMILAKTDPLMISFWTIAGMALTMSIVSYTLARKIGLLRKHQSNLQDRASSLETGLSKTEKEFVSAQREVGDLKNIEVNANTEIRRLKDSLEAASKERDRLSKENIAFQKNSSRQQQELEQNAAQRAQLENTLKEKEQVIYKLQGTNLEITTKIQEFESSLKSLSYEKEAHQKALSQQQQELEQLTSQGAELRENLRQREQEIQQLQSANNAMTEKIQGLDLQVQGLEKEKTANHKTISSQQQELERLTVECVELKQQLREKEEHRVELQGANKEMTAKIHELESSFKGLSQETQTQRKTLSQEQQELEQLTSQNQELQNTLTEKQQNIKKLEEENQTLNKELKEALTQAQESKREAQGERILIDEIKKQVDARNNAQAKAGLRPESAKDMEDKEAKLASVLLGNELVAKATLDKALELRKKFKRNLLQFLFVNRDIRDIDENQLVESFSSELKVPYLPLGSYEISDPAISLIPSAVVEEHWLLAVDKVENNLVVVMVDPFDSVAIRKIEKLTGFTVKVYIGLFSEIAQKIKHFYKVNIRGLDAEGNPSSPIFIRTISYKGRERRRAVRFKAEIALKVADDEHVVLADTENIGWDGLSFELDHGLPIYSTLTVQLTIPGSKDQKNKHSQVAAVAQVIRATPGSKNKFMIGMQFLNIPKDDIKAILNYCSLNQNKEEL